MFIRVKYGGPRGPFPDPHQRPPFYRGSDVKEQLLRMRKWALIIGGVGFAVWITHREEAPMTKRKRFIFFREETVRKLSEGEFRSIQRQFEGRILPKNHPLTQAVAEVGSRIAAASDLQGLQWEFFVVDAPKDMNAFVLPCGKVFVFTGLFRAIENRDALAAVIGHEVGHIVAKHQNEALSQSLILAAPFYLAAIFLLGGYNDFVSLVYDLGVKLRGSRKRELEADYIGLHLMAKACYDPRHAPRVFQKLGRMQKELKLLKYVSTHPLSEERVKNLEKYLPEAIEVYQNQCLDAAWSFPAVHEREFYEDSNWRWA